jgi:predicted TIM-barrel fold metal-dependent hydrolase
VASNVAGVRFVEALPLSPAYREKIAHGNAERLLRLERYTCLRISTVVGWS